MIEMKHMIVGSGDCEDKVDKLTRDLKRSRL